ncbi:MAG: 8-amino-7-oxononanoate synthase, partial [Rhodothermales bacterium]|nr:8-amino-7-oxononanoate synthase [Rhodothermales bacterium]
HHHPNPMRVRSLDARSNEALEGTEVAQTDLGQLDLRDLLVRSRRLGLQERARFFSDWIRTKRRRGDTLHLRPVHSATDRVTRVGDFRTGEVRPMLMFGSNSYLGLMTHPHVRERMKAAIDDFGAGVSGAPLLNGRSALHYELEERIAAFKGKEDAVIFQSGYGANVGVLATLAGKRDRVVCDALSHASFKDGTKMSAAPTLQFPHNDVAELAHLLDRFEGEPGETFVGVEGAYSMDGDLAPLDRIVEACRGRDTVLIVDDAHGTGVTGPGGRGTAAHFGVTDEVDLILSTFSKTFGVTGAAVCCSRAVADFLRFYASSYAFSSSLPPASVAAVLAGLDVIEREPGRVERLRHNMAYTARRLRECGFRVPEPESAVIAVMAPAGLNIRRAAFDLHQRGIFLNCIEYPGVPANQQRFRISLMATHTEADIDRLVTALAEVWDEYAPEEHRLSRAGAPNPARRPDRPSIGDGMAEPAELRVREP